GTAAEAADQTGHPAGAHTVRAAGRFEEGHRGIWPPLIGLARVGGWLGRRVGCKDGGREQQRARRCHGQQRLGEVLGDHYYSRDSFRLLLIAYTAVLMSRIRELPSTAQKYLSCCSPRQWPTGKFTRMG